MGDDAASAESSRFSRRRIRPLEGKGQTLAKHLRGTLGNIGNAFPPPDLLALEGEKRRSQTD